MVRYSKKIHTLELQSNNLKKEGIIQIIKAVEPNTNLKGLNLSDNLKGKNPEVTKCIADMIGESSLEFLNLSNNDLGRDISPIFKALANNKKLLELDVTGNHMGDAAATELAEGLSKNTSLTSLQWDENAVNLGGWQAFCSALKNNKALQKMPSPEKDIAKAMSAAKDKSRQKEKINEVMASISQILKDNTND